MSNVTSAVLPTARGGRQKVHWGDPLTYALALAIAAVSIGPIVFVILGGFRKICADERPIIQDRL